MPLSDFYSSASFPKAYRTTRVPAPNLRSQKGPVARARHRKRLAHVQAKRTIKAEVRVLDENRCRWPECDAPPESFWGQIDVAHYKADGMGGDPSLERMTPDNLLLLCKFHHVGPRGLHSGLARMEALSEDGMRGPVMFLRLERGESGRWLLAGITEPPKEGA
jgi:hypothetical protein